MSSFRILREIKKDERSLIARLFCAVDQDKSAAKAAGASGREK